MNNYEILNHGVEHSDYFQGCGCAFTRYMSCVTGCGMNAKEAYEDAIEQIYGAHFDSKAVDGLKLPENPKGHGINKKNKVSAKDQKNEDNSMYYYV